MISQTVTSVEVIIKNFWPESS